MTYRDGAGRHLYQHWRVKEVPSCPADVVPVDLRDALCSFKHLLLYTAQHALSIELKLVSSRGSVWDRLQAADEVGIGLFARSRESSGSQHIMDTTPVPAFIVDLVVQGISQQQCCSSYYLTAKLHDIMA